MHTLSKQTGYTTFSQKKEILLVVTLNLGAPRSHMPGTIFLQRCVIKGRAQTDCKERRWSGAAAAANSWLIYRNTSENNFAAALSLPFPSVVSKGSVKLSACWILWLGAFAQKKCVFFSSNDLVRSFIEKTFNLIYCLNKNVF